MKVKELLSEGLKREYNVTVPAENVDGAINQKLQLIGKDLKMPGFRPGKVPMDVVKKTHGKKVLGEALEALVQNTSMNAIEKEKIRPAVQPKIEVIKFEEGQDLEYKMEVEILPDMPKIDFSKITVEKPVAKVEKKEVTDAIRRIADGHKHFHPVKDNRASKKGDAVVMDFKGFVDGEAFEGGEAKGHQIELGSNSFIPGFEDQLIGLKVGDEKDVSVSFPEEYHAAHLAGKDAKFEVKIHEVKEVEKHKDIDDEFAKHLGMETLEQLENAVRGQIESEVEEASRRLAKKALFDSIDEKCDFEVPEQMFKNEFDIIWEQHEQAKAQNPTSEEFNKPEKELKAEYEEMANRRVRLGILLSETSREKNVQVTPEEIRAAVLKEAQKYPGQEQAVIEYYQSNQQNMQALRGPVLEEKVVGLILGEVKIKEVSLTMDEMRYYEDSGEKKVTKNKTSSKKSSAKKKTSDKKTGTKKNAGKGKKTTKTKK